MQQYQAYQVDQRELNIDQRSIHFQHNIFNPDPSVVGHLAATAATSEVRAEATHAVSAVVTEATSAVAAARAQTSEAVVRAEATQAVAQARESAMDFELRSLRAMVESLRAENEDLRNRARTIEAQSPNVDPTSSLNGAVIEHRIVDVEMENFIQTGILPRLTHLEGTFTLLRDLDHQVRENILPRMQGLMKVCINLWTIWRRTHCMSHMLPIPGLSLAPMVIHLFIMPSGMILMLRVIRNTTRKQVRTWKGKH